MCAVDGFTAFKFFRQVCPTNWWKWHHQEQVALYPVELRIFATIWLASCSWVWSGKPIQRFQGRVVFVGRLGKVFILNPQLLDAYRAGGVSGQNLTSRIHICQSRAGGIQSMQLHAVLMSLISLVRFWPLLVKQGVLLDPLIRCGIHERHRKVWAFRPAMQVNLQVDVVSNQPADPSTCRLFYDKWSNFATFPR